MNDGTFKPVDPQVRIGHVHLKVADLERAIAFYHGVLHGVLGFEITERWGNEPRSSRRAAITITSA